MTLRCFLVGLALVAMAGRADAAFTVSFAQVGNDVVATGIGSLNTTGLTTRTGTSLGASVQPGKGIVVLGLAAAAGYTHYNVFFSSNTTFGPGNGAQADSGNGPQVGLSISLGEIFAPPGYASGTSIDSSATFGNRTLAGLGLAAGTYSYSYSATQGGLTIDTITIQVGPASVPEPASLKMVGVALVSVGLVARRGRRG